MVAQVRSHGHSYRAKRLRGGHGVQIDGVDRIAKRLNQKYPTAVLRVAQSAINKTAREVYNTAKYLAPVATGELKNSITLLPASGDRGRDALTATVETLQLGAGHARTEKDFYTKARAVEFGRKTGNRGTTEPQPFLLPIIRLKHKTYVSRIRRAVVKAAKETRAG